MTTVTKDITAQNTFSDGFGVQTGKGVQDVHLSIYGTFSATVVVQVKENGAADSTYRDLTGESYTAAAERVLSIASGLTVRVGVKTGGFSSGTVSVRLGD